MKDKLEHTLKNLLENQELPYDSAAWDSMKQALDAKLPVQQPTNWYKWFLGGAAITVIAVSSYFFIQKKEVSRPDLKLSKETEMPSTKNPAANQVNQKKNTTPKQEAVTSHTSNTNKSITSEVTNTTQLNQYNTYNTAELNAEVKEITAILNQEILLEESVIEQVTLEPTSSKKGINELISSDQIDESIGNSKLINAVNMCLGERQLLENTNDFAVSIYKQNASQPIATIEAKKSLYFEAKEQGTFLLVDKTKKITENTPSFEVKNSPKPTLEIETEIRYEKGVPTLKASTDASNSVQWTINNEEVSSTKNELDFNPFKAGNYTLTVKTLAEGCQVSQTAKTNVDEDYNLLAVNAFNPNSLEPRNQTFIPFALTQRDVKFTLLILDPKDGGIMYQTEDASQPWNGIDKRTGQLAPSSQAYIWKVRLSNPLPGEPTEYKGTITKL